MREAIAELIAGLLVRVSASRRAYQNQKVEELTQTVLDYGQMVLHLYPEQAVLVEVEELACRLRETPRTIAKVLNMLESQSKAQRTQLAGQWRLRVELQYSRGRHSERDKPTSGYELLQDKERHFS